MNAGLVVFIGVVALNVGGLLLDLLLSTLGVATITSLVRGGNWWVGSAIVLLQGVGIVGLTYHFCCCQMDWMNDL